MNVTVPVGTALTAAPLAMTVAVKVTDWAKVLGFAEDPSVTAEYGGDANFAAGISTGLAQTVNPSPTATALGSDVNPSNAGQSVTFTATVTSAAGTPTGNVTFKDGASTLGTGALSAGVATLSTAGLSAGTHTIIATYDGGGNFAMSTSSELMQTVRRLWTITVNGSAGGTVSGGGTVPDGSPVSVVATPKRGYAFVNWTERGSQVSASATYDFTAQANRKLVASFQALPPTCILKVTPTLIQKGEGATLAWASDNATEGTIDNGVGAVSAKGSMAVSPTSTTTYHATFSGKGGSVDCSATLSVAEVTLLHSFQGGSTDGAFPTGALLFGENGELFGTTQRGGTANLGTVFRLTSQAATAGPWTPSLLHRFLGVSSEGSLPSGGLVRSAAGELFGTTAFGGTDTGCMANPTIKGCGTVFRLTPPTPPASKWKLTQYHFVQASPEGGYPSSDLLLDADGGLFGMTTAQDGCSQDCGTVFKLTAVGAKRWKQAVQLDFSSKVGLGRLPTAGGLTAGPDGTLYGVTASGGGSGNCIGGCGTIFSLAPVVAASSRARLRYTRLYSFSGADGRSPLGTLAIDSDGSLYGVTFEGGSGAGCMSSYGGCGTVFKLSPPAPGKKNWKLATLANFAGGSADGSHPRAGLLLRDGKLYGTTAYGGSGSCADGFDTGCGTAFILSREGAKWERTTLHTFTGGESDGAWPMAPLIADDADTLYGSTAGGGSGTGCGGPGCGTVFMLVR